MAGPFPRPDTETSESAGFLWIAVAIILFVAAGLFIMTRTERHTREAAERSQTPVQQREDGSPLIRFSPTDIQVDTGWSLLAGRHPTVTFTCQLAPDAPKAEAVILCYHTLGTPDWYTVTAHARRDRIWRITLRDLYRNMPYECFFIFRTADTVVRSGCVRFHT